MRILTVRQPWAWAIIHGGKTVENRVRNIAGDYRGPVLIHVGLRDDDAAFDPEHPMYGMLFRPCPWVDAPTHNRHHCRFCKHDEPLKFENHGHIIGVVDMIDVHLGLDQCTPWSEYDTYHLVLANPRALDEPVPHKGALGLRKTDFAVIGDTLAAPWGHPNRSCTPYGCEPGCELEPVAKLIPADITRMEQGT